ncbi:hypothetical protein [Taklimakanibacter lacteus]|uniref:hypothetical protein n=1 Tax=Taklimakanibacter lacteus TaxID=2268456 RepID=UPI0013C528CD
MEQKAVGGRSNRLMKAKRKFDPKTLRVDDQIARARKLAAISVPMVAELYLSHIEFCEAKQPKHHPRSRPARQWPSRRS